MTEEHRSLGRSRCPQIAIDRAAIKAFCERHHVARLAVFGSVLRDDFHADKFLNIRIRERVLREAEPLYVAA